MHQDLDPPAAKPPGPASAGRASKPRRRRRLVGLLLAVAVAVAVLVVLLVARPPSGRLLAVADFESGDFSQWTEVQAVDEERYRVVGNPHAQGALAGRMESAEDECIPMDCDGDLPRGRTEALLKGDEHDIEEGQDVWYRWYTMFPDEGELPEFTFSQWRADDEQESPRAKDGLYGLMTVGRSDESPDGYIAFQRNGDRWTTPLQRGKWMKFVMHIRYSSDPDEGLYELWVDGEHAVSFNEQSKPSNTGVYFKQGVYRNGDTPAATVYHDGLRVATSRELADIGWIDRLLGRDVGPVSEGGGSSDEQGDDT